jgi:hypothetical protein
MPATRYTVGTTFAEAILKTAFSFVLISAIILFNARSLIAQNAPAAMPGKPTIFVCGDSTSKYNGSETMDKLQELRGKPMAGWGTPIATFFDPAKVTINNVGHAGTSSRTYYNGDWPRVLPQIKQGDYVLLVFGINDGGLGTPNGIGDEVIERPVARRGGGNSTRGAGPNGTTPHLRLVHVQDGDRRAGKRREGRFPHRHDAQHVDQPQGEISRRPADRR